MNSFGICLLQIAVFLTVCLGFSSGQENHNCTRHLTLTPVHNFSTEKILGNWIWLKGFAAIPEDAVSPTYTCHENNISRSDEDPNQLVLTGSALNTTGGGPFITISIASVSEETPAIWAVNDDPPSEYETHTVYVHTDYDNWALQFTCTGRRSHAYEFMQVWTRTRNPDPELIALLDVLVQNYGFSLENEFIIGQNDCP